MVPRARGGSRASRPSSCPLLHTRHSTVCTSGQGRLVTANLASDFAHAIRQRVHERTGAAPFCQSRVRLCTRAGVPCAQTETSRHHSPRERPLAHTDILVARGCGHRGVGTDIRAPEKSARGGVAYKAESETRLPRPPTRPHVHAAASAACECARAGGGPARERRASWPT